MSNYDRIIAIDPDARESGVAELEIKTKEINVYKMDAAQLMHYLTVWKTKEWEG